jgi:hypothetical protein
MIRYLIATPSRRTPPHVLKNPAPALTSRFLAGVGRRLTCVALTLDLRLLGPPAVEQMVGHPQVSGHLCDRPRRVSDQPTASALNSSVYRRRVLVIMPSSDCILLLLSEVSVQSGEGQAGFGAPYFMGARFAKVPLPTLVEILDGTAGALCLVQCYHLQDFVSGDYPAQSPTQLPIVQPRDPLGFILGT